MDFGLRVPSYADRTTSSARSRALVPYFSAVEEAGFSSLWVIDHLLIPPHAYSVSWQDPMITLAVAAGATEQIRLGTAILVAPLRHPVITAKEIASLNHLAGAGRVVLGVGTGHDEKEFQSVGVHKSERGRRTDEVLDLIRLLLSEDDVHYEGDFYRVDGVSLYPRPEEPIPIWIGGGSQVHIVGNPDVPDMVPAVLERIARHQGWICRSGGTSSEIVAEDISRVTQYLESRRPVDDFTVSHAQWFHIVSSTDREAIIDQQLAVYRTVMDDRRSDEDLMRAYLFGTIDEMVARIRDLKDAGVEHLIVNPVTDDLAQIDLFAKEIMPNV